MSTSTQPGNEGARLSTVTIAIAFLISYQQSAAAYEYMEAAKNVCPESHFCTKARPDSQSWRRGVADDDRSLHTIDRTTRRPGDASSDIPAYSSSTDRTSRNPPTTTSTITDASTASFDDAVDTNAPRTETTYSAIISNKTNNVPNTDIDNNDLIPCCHPCSCDPDCQQRGTCCPDVTQRSKLDDLPKTEKVRKENDMAPASCMMPVHQNFNPFVSEDLPRYKIISQCPTGYTDLDEIEFCNNKKVQIIHPIDLDDVVMVSDVHDPDTIFLNRHCAACNNVTRVTRWTMKIIGNCHPGAYEHIISTADSASSYLVYSCPIVFEPRGIQLSARAPCDMHVVSTCNVTGQWDAYDLETELACLRSDVPYLDPYILDPLQSRYTRYRNVFCFLCNQPAGVSRPDVCSRQHLGLTTQTYTNHTKIVVLEPNVFINRSYTDICGNARIQYDPILKKCRVYYCAMNRYGQNNKCIRLSKQTYGVILETHLMLKPTANVACSRNLSLSSSGNQLKFQQWLLRTIGIADCQVSAMKVTVYWRESVAKEADFLKAIVIVADIATNRKCTLEDVDDVLSLRSNNGSSFPVSLDGYFVNLEETIDLSATIIEAGWQAPEMKNDATQIVRMNRRSSPRMNLASRYYCPYLILTYREYCQYSALFGKPCPNITLSSGHSLMPGFSLILTERVFKVVVCKDIMYGTYQSSPNVPATRRRFTEGGIRSKTADGTVSTVSPNIIQSGGISNLPSTPAVSVTAKHLSNTYSSIVPMMITILTITELI